MRNIVLFVNISDVFCDLGPLISLNTSKRQLQRSNRFIKDVGLQLGTLPDVKIFCRRFLRFVIRIIGTSRLARQIHQIFG